MVGCEHRVRGDEPPVPGDVGNGDGRTRLHVTSLVDSFESRDAWLRSGMEVGVNEGYAKLEELIANGAV